MSLRAKDRAHGIGGIGVGIDDQDAPWGCSRGRTCGLARSLRPIQPPEVDREHRAPALAIAHGLDAAAMHLDQSLDDRESDTEAAASVLAGLIALHEGLENAWQQGGCDSGPIVANAERDLGAGLGEREMDLAA